jgi:hypothetical protein
MGDIYDRGIAILQLTAKTLEDLGITKEVGKTVDKKARIDEYAKCFRQLWQAIDRPKQETTA